MCKRRSYIGRTFGRTINLATDEFESKLKIKMALIEYEEGLERKQKWFSNHYGTDFIPEYIGEVVIVSEDFDGIYLVAFRHD